MLPRSRELKAPIRICYLSEQRVCRPIVRQKVEKQDDAGSTGAIPGFVFDAVVEDDRCAQLPGACFAEDSKGAVPGGDD